MSVDWRQARALFEQALEIPEDTRSAWLEAACSGDGELLAEVAGLLDHAVRSAGRLEAPSRDGPSSFGIQGGQRVGAYRVEWLLASGGMGSVWLGARADGAYEKRVAIKFIRRELAGPRMAARFERERQVLAPLEHPGIARLLDGGTTADGAPFLVMEYVDGEPIDVHCDRRRLDIRARLELFARTCDAVDYAHRQQVVHRDLKPGNLLVTREGAPKLLDFGIAKLLDEGAAEVLESLTATGEYVLSPRYASPEQCAGEPVGPASDVYSLGVLLFELLTARLPYERSGSGLVELHRSIRFDEPTRASRAVLRTSDPWLTLRDGANAESVAEQRGTTPRGLARILRGDLDRILQMALAKEPGRRYASAADLALDVRRYLTAQPVQARGPSGVYRATRLVARHRRPLVAVLAALLLVVPLAWRLGSASLEAVTTVEAWSYTPGEPAPTPIVTGSRVRRGDDLGVRVASSRPTTLYALSVHGGQDPEERFVVPLRPVELVDGAPSPRGAASWGLDLHAGNHELVCARLEDPSPREGLLVFVAREPVRTLERWLGDLDAEGGHSPFGVSRQAAFTLLDNLRSESTPRGRAIPAGEAGMDDAALLRAERERYAGLTAAAAAGLEDWGLGADVVRFELLCEVLAD